MKTVAIALPNRLQPEYSREFSEWCEENGIMAECTRMFAEVPQRLPLHIYYTVWQITGTDTDLVHVKLRWCEDMAEKWKLSRLERAVAEMLDWEVEERL